jgi:3',5'-cyclic AMP phosphodiesterase CpdA
MSLLVTLGLGRRNKWERPTLLDHLFTSPLQALISQFYAFVLFLRGRPFLPPRDKPAIRVVCISDTHDQTTAVPDGDLLIHAGDLTNAGTIDDLQRQIDWLDALPHRHKVIVCGNHDSYFDVTARSQADRDSGRSLDLKSIHYLERKSVTLEFAGRRRLKVYGAPDLPVCGEANFA